MKQWMMASAALFFSTGGMWFFQDTLAEMTLDREHMRRQVVSETMITIGRVEGCKAEVSLSTWADLNKMGICAWTTACKTARKETSQ